MKPRSASGGFKELMALRSNVGKNDMFAVISSFPKQMSDAWRKAGRSAIDALKSKLN
jgi:hypothetical protein